MLSDTTIERRPRPSDLTTIEVEGRELRYLDRGYEVHGADDEVVASLPLLDPELSVIASEALGTMKDYLSSPAFLDDFKKSEAEKRRAWRKSLNPVLRNIVERNRIRLNVVNTAIPALETWESIMDLDEFMQTAVEGAKTLYKQLKGETKTTEVKKTAEELMHIFNIKDDSQLEAAAKNNGYKKQPDGTYINRVEFQEDLYESFSDKQKTQFTNDLTALVTDVLEHFGYQVSQKQE
jgi:hypothetical protein